MAPSRSAATELVDESDMEKWAAEAEQPVANGEDCCMPVLSTSFIKEFSFKYRLS